MAERKWTEEQEAAIRARNWSVLVSAAAGSGKTAVLVERITRLVMEGARLSRMLIVTFTRAAAGEMRARLNSRLSDLLREEDVPAEMREIFSQALEDLPDAQISTIHSFCQHVLAQDFQQVGIDPEARVADSQKRQELFERAFREAINSLLEGDDPDFALLMDCFAVERLREMTGTLHTFLMSLHRPWDWLDTACGVPGRPLDTEHPWVRELLRAAESQVSELIARAGLEERLLEEPDAIPAYAPAVAADLALAERISCAGDTFSAVRVAAASTVERLKAARGLTEEQQAWKERFGRARDAFKEALETVQAWAAFDAQKEGAELERLAACLRALRALTRLTDERFAALKREKSLIDFNDMEQLTLQILEDKLVRERYQQEYDFLFVDECQDVSESQDAIISAIHGPESCLFLVGDVKQSIYRFRRADPTIFIRRVQTWSDDADARERRIFLTRNFRSRPTVLAAANEVFQRAMQQTVTELDYQPQDWLRPCRETADDPPAEIILAEGGPEGLKPLEAEAALAAEMIAGMVGKPYTDFDGKPQTLRYRDICVLMREVSTSGVAVRDALAARGIPVYFDSNERYADLQEVRTMTDMLQLIDNPLQDLPLLGALRSDWFSFTDEELADIRLGLEDRDAPFHAAFARCAAEDTPLGEKCRAVEQTLHGWRMRMEHSRLSDFVWALMHESGYYAAEGALPGGETRMANLRMLYSQTQQFEQAGGLSLGEFLRVLRLQSESGDARAAKLLGENEDLVRVMTMHKSKGLEFPVVICLRLTAGMHHRENGQLQLHPRLGACLPVIRREQRLTRDCFAAPLFTARHRQDEMAETCRLLYVAMTRAKERLILMGSAGEVTQDALELPPGDTRVASARSMMDWILHAAVDLRGRTDLTDGAAPPFTITNLSAPETGGEEQAGSADGGGWLTALETALPTAPPLWPAPEEGAPLPQKISVTALAHREASPLPLPEEEETPETKRRQESAILSAELPDRPAFLMEARALTAAERGTVTHRFLANAPYEGLRGLRGEKLRGALEDLLRQEMEAGIFTPEEAACVSIPATASFFESGLGQRALAADNVRRELPFNLALTDGRTILQGVIDCCFVEDGAWILVDYKTDRVTDVKAFMERHRAQLDWYAKALARITGLPVREQWLYALGIRQAVLVHRAEEVGD